MGSTGGSHPGQVTRLRSVQALQAGIHDCVPHHPALWDVRNTTGKPAVSDSLGHVKPWTAVLLRHSRRKGIKQAINQSGQPNLIRGGPSQERKDEGGLRPLEMKVRSPVHFSLLPRRPHYHGDSSHPGCWLSAGATKPWQQQAVPDRTQLEWYRLAWGKGLGLLWQILSQYHIYMWLY